MNTMLNKKQFLLYAIQLAFPIMIQNLISTLVNSADTVMLGYVSQSVITCESVYVCPVLLLLWTGHRYKRPVCAVLGKGRSPDRGENTGSGH